MLKNLVKVSIIISFIMISFNLFSQQKIIFKNYEGKFPVKKGMRGIRGVTELSKSIIIVLEDQEILLPKGAIITDIDELGKVILPENYTCTIKMGKYNIIVPEGGVIKFDEDGISELHVDNDFLEIAGQQIAFRDNWSNGVRFENNTIKSGYLKNDIIWNHYGTMLNLHNYKGDTYLAYKMIGNISFYPNETLMEAFLTSEVLLKTPDNQVIKVNPGFVSFYPNGKLKSCFLGEDKTFIGSEYSFIIPKGNQIYFEESGRLAIDKRMIVKNLKIKMLADEIPKAKLYFNDKKEIILDEINISKPLQLKVITKTGKFNYTNNIFFMDNGDRSLTFYNNQTPWYGYLAKDQDVTIGDNSFKLKKGSFIRFYDNGMIEEAKLAEEKVITYLNKKYKLLQNCGLKFYKNGEIDSDMFQYQNKANGLVITLD